MVKIEIGFTEIAILMHGLPHVILKKELLTAIQSWVEGFEEEATFHIEYHMSSGGNVVSEYWDKEHWTAVLTELKRYKLFMV